MKFDKADVFLRNYILILTFVLIAFALITLYTTQLGGGYPLLIPLSIIAVILVIIGIALYLFYKHKLKVEK